MHSYSPRHDDDINEDVFDDDTNAQLNNSSSDIKLRRTTNPDSSNYPVIHRALSTVSANQSLVNNQRNVLAKNFRRISVNDEIVTIDHTDADASFILPNLYELSDDIRTRVMDSLVDTPTMATLEETRRLNWWVNKKLPCPKLYPLLTSGDGNCLLHATSLAMWGFHDHSLSMRKALNETMITSKPNNSLYRRWRWAQYVQNKKYGLVFSEQEWNEEWKGLLRLSSAEPRVSQISSNTNSSDPNSSTDESKSYKSSQTVTVTNTGGSTKSSSQSTRQYYESLEEFHVYVLANNIRRPIIIYSDTILRTNDGEAISPIEFGGIYLPLEIPPEKCHKQPVFLAFDAAHFSALVPMEQNSKPASKVTYRIPLIDIDAIDLLPIHYFIDPGASFAWPIDEELSDDKIHLYTHYGESRMETLEKYLNLSKENCSFNSLIPSTSTTNNNNNNNNTLNDESTSTTDNNPSSTINLDLSTTGNDTNSITTPVINKKSTRPSLNSFSKIIRRTFIEPFSSNKRGSFKLKGHHPNPDASDTSIIPENEHLRRASSPLLNRRTNNLTIIVTNFQPKRPKASDNMTKNYIDSCMNDYRIEKNSKQSNETSTLNENETNSTKDNYSDRNNDVSSYQQPTMYHRYPSSSSSSSTTANTSRYQPNTSQTTNTKEKVNETSGRKMPSIPNNSTNKINLVAKRVQKPNDIDDNDDTIPMENGQFSTNINYVQSAQRKSNYIPPSNSLEMNHGRHHYPESYMNGLSPNRTIKGNIPEGSPKNHPITAPLPSTFQPSLLKRQQSLGVDKNAATQRLPDSNINTRGSIKLHNNYQSNRPPNIEQQKRL
ncbi:unnamed protein product [Adineta steineri]|uniref:ubiquitinyl hydrolase 1 n=1 Tax=Adineta steineri TaxID=433720 RepID=A0A814J054_9BILA|nr:unnamed protein product [Adineta steineri]